MPSTRVRPRLAVITAPVVEVGCPHCGEAQPNPSDGSHTWSLDEFRDASGQRRECVACDLPFTIMHSHKAQLS